ncbi:MAG: hypothetical protein L6V84_00145 [Oscillospiraceae bacterium]|nr:MAG: hypothetical protein L6V84_00145 [Oscillospiraceae bacterium]
MSPSKICRGTGVPKTLAELRQYDQILLNNIANSDLPAGLDELLYRYVNECGGGLFTVGGADINPSATDENDRYIAHAYNRDDMLNTLFRTFFRSRRSTTHRRLP